jgi:Flp pilus assembly protein TadD
MNRVSGLLLAVGMVLVPMAAQAQKPSDVSETRSADVYVAQAEKTPVASEKKEFYEKALDMAKQAAAKYPSNPKPYFQMGMILSQLHDYVGADTSFIKAQSMYPAYAKDIDQERFKMWTTTYNEGVLKIKAGDAAAGVERLELAGRLLPSRPETQQVLGSIYLQMGDLEKAEKAYKAELAALRGPERAKLDAKKQAQWAESELNAVKALATMYSSLGRNTEAETMYRELLVKDPENPAILSNLAIVLTREKKTSDANVIYQQLLTRTDLSGTQLLNVGIGLHNAGEYAKAADAFDRATSQNPYMYDILDFEVNSLSGIVEQIAPKAAGSGADAVAAKAELIKQYNRIVDAATKALAISPLDATMVMRLAAAQRGLSDNDTPKAADWRKAVLASLERNQAMPISLTMIQSAADDKSVTLSGNATGMSAKEGTPVKVKFSLLDKDGKVVATKDLEIPAPAKDATQPFTVTIEAPATAISWKYEQDKQ